MAILQGFIKGVTYQAHLTPQLVTYNWTDFDVNGVKPYGLIRTDSSELAYSRWVSPKRTRSYPFERIYNTYNAGKILTIIPIIKDEGADGDIDKINFSTFSWMNLLNIYIVLGFYGSAEKNLSSKQITKEKLTKQQFDNEFVRRQIAEIIAYKQSALHWNKNLFKERFIDIVRQSLSAYQQISQQTGVAIHAQSSIERWVGRIEEDFATFRQQSNLASQRAMQRELVTLNPKEFLDEHNTKGEFYIQNYLGGEYYLTADEIFEENGVLVIQESKNTKQRNLPSIGDIRDGLFKLILFTNLDRLQHNGGQVAFVCRLRLTGRGVAGILTLPTSPHIIQNFLNQNLHLQKHQNTILNLNKEANVNGLQVIVEGNNL